MRWLSQTFAVTGAQPADHSAAPQLVGGRHRRHRRRRRRVRLGAVDRRRVLGGDAAVRLAAARARHAQRRRQRDDERPGRARGRHHQAGAGHPARRPDAARVGRAVRDHRPAEEVDTGHAGQRADARHRADRRCRSARKCRSIEGRMFEFGTNEVIVGRGASGQFASLEVGNTIVSGQNRWQVVGIFEADGGVAETRDLVRRAGRCRAPTGAATRTSPCSRAWTRRIRSTRSTTG